MFSAPIINDITTTYPNPPQYVALAVREKSRDYKYLDANFATQSAFYKDLAPLVLPGFMPLELFKTAADLATKQGWEIVSRDEAALRIEAVATTSLLRFKDDIVIEIRYSTAGGHEVSTVHMRSKSRRGRGDFGVNAARISKFILELKSRAMVDR